MQITIKKDGNEAGPFSIDEVAAMLADGRINKTDLAFHEGLSNWLPVLAVITTRGTPPPFKEKTESAKDRLEHFDSSRVKPNATVDSIIKHIKSLDWNQIFPFKSVLEDKPWNLRWVRWVLWFACSFFLINHYLSTNDMDSDQAAFLLNINWSLVLALGLSFIIKPDQIKMKRALCLVVPAMLLSVILFVVAGKIHLINLLYQATVDDGIIKRAGSILVAVLINQLILSNPFVFIYMRKKLSDSGKNIMVYGLLAGMALSMTPMIISLMQHKWYSLNGLSLGIFESRLFYGLLTLSFLSGICGALTGHLIARGVKNQQNSFGWVLAAILVPTGLEAVFLAATSIFVGLLVILTSVFLLSNYLKSQSDS